MHRYAAVLVTLLIATPARTQVIPFDLIGRAGPGLQPGNETGPAVSSTGAGGEGGAGISFNATTNALTVNIGWSSLTGDAIAGHIQGPTQSPAPASFDENAGILISLQFEAGWDPSASNGGFAGTVTVPAANVADLFEGRLYINIRTTANTSGEIRGNLVPVPELNSLLLVLPAAAGWVTFWRRRWRRASLVSSPCS